MFAVLSDECYTDSADDSIKKGVTAMKKVAMPLPLFLLLLVGMFLMLVDVLFFREGSFSHPSDKHHYVNYDPDAFESKVFCDDETIIVEMPHTTINELIKGVGLIREVWMPGGGVCSIIITFDDAYIRDIASQDTLFGNALNLGLEHWKELGLTGVERDKEIERISKKYAVDLKPGVCVIVAYAQNISKIEVSNVCLAFFNCTQKPNVDIRTRNGGVIYFRHISSD